MKSSSILNTKCFEFKHYFERNEELYFNFGLDTVFLEFNLIDVEFELMFYSNRSFNLENKIFIPTSSFTVIKYVAIYTIPVDENVNFCLDNQDDQSDHLIRQVREALTQNEYKTSTTSITTNS